MSFYATIEGHITYPGKEAYDKACELLGMGEKNGWVDKNGYFVDECGTRFCEEPHDPNCNPLTLSIFIPCGHYRNLARQLDALIENTKSEIVWTSTDGMFGGGVIENGKETFYELGKWAAENLEDKEPSQDAFDEYCEWQSDVEREFISDFAP